MLETSFKKEVRLYEFTAGDGRLYRLSYPNRWLVPVEISQCEEFATFEYNINELEPLENMRSRPLLDRLRLLINVAGLEELKEEYSFSLSPDNLYEDRNLEPLVLMRDLISEDNRHDFVAEYRALAGTMLVTKYSFADYLEGGQELCKKSKRIKELLGAQTTQEIQNILKTKYEVEQKRIQKQKVLIDRRQKRFLQISAPVCFVLFLAGAAAAYMYFVVVPFDNALLNANRAFLRENFDSAIDTLRPIDPTRMEREERFQLARAYIIAESLTPAQRAHILSDITLLTDDNLLLFWIAIGRLEHESAIDLAMRIGDDELLLYALVKYEVAVQMDQTLPGQERMDLLASLNHQIDSLRRQQEDRRLALEEEAAAQALLDESEQLDEPEEYENGEQEDDVEDETADPEEEGGQS